MTEELLTAEVRIRLTPTEKQQLKSLANANELPLSTFLRVVFRRETPNYTRNRFYA